MLKKPGNYSDASIGAWASGEMADARGLGPRGETLAGSSPVSPTNPFSRAHALDRDCPRADQGLLKTASLSRDHAGQPRIDPDKHR